MVVGQGKKVDLAKKENGSMASKKGQKMSKFEKISGFCKEFDLEKQDMKPLKKIENEKINRNGVVFHVFAYVLTDFHFSEIIRGIKE